MGLGIDGVDLCGGRIEGWLSGRLRTEPFRDVVSLSRSRSADGVLARGGAKAVEARRTTPPIRAHLDLGEGEEVLMTSKEGKGAASERVTTKEEERDGGEMRKGRLRFPYNEASARRLHRGRE